MSSDISKVESDDDGMNKAMEKARETFPEFWHEVFEDYRRIIPILGTTLVKAHFFEPEDPAGGEHIWVDEVKYNGEAISGILAGVPVDISSVREGEAVSFPVSRLSDWLYIKDGKAFGAFTIRLLRTRMTDAERTDHDRHYPFSFD